MKKFSRIIESNENSLIPKIKDIFLEFQDMEFSINITHSKGHYNIILKTPYNNSIKNNWMYCVNELSVANDRLGDLNLEYIDSKCIMLGNDSNTHPNYSKIDVMYRLKDSNFNYDDIDTYDEFRLYCINVLGKNIESFDSYDTDCFEQYGFGIFILNELHFS